MKTTQRFHRLPGLRLSAALLMGAALTLVACKKQGENTANAASSAQPAGSALASGGACTDYATKLCDQAGAESPTCQAVRTTTEIMPAQACSAGLKDIEFSKKKLSEKGKACDELIEKLCGEVGPTTESCNMVKEQTKKFPPERCTLMLEHIPEIVADLKKQEEKNQPLKPEQQVAVAAGTGPSFGPADAKVTLVEFSDFQCPYCSRAAQTMHKLKEKYEKQVRFVFRQFPLSFHDKAREAAEASLAAHAQGKFWAFHDKLFENQSALDRPSLEKYAQATGLDVAAFKKALDTHQFGPAVDADLKLGADVVVEGTPTLFLNGARVANPSDLEAISKQIDDALKS